MEYEDTITLTGSSHYHNPPHTTAVSKTYPSFTTVDELLDGMKEIALALGYSEVAWNRAILELADDLADRELDDLLDTVDALDDEREVPCPCDECRVARVTADHAPSRGCRGEHRASRA